MYTLGESAVALALRARDASLARACRAPFVNSYFDYTPKFSVLAESKRNMCGQGPYSVTNGSNTPG